MRIPACLLSVALICGCLCLTPGGGPGGLKTTSTSIGPDTSLLPDKASCESRGGRWGRIGLSPRPSCNLPASDGGKACSDSDECDGSCLADLDANEMEAARKGETLKKDGKCTPWMITVGCQARVEDGKVRGLLCMD